MNVSNVEVGKLWTVKNSIHPKTCSDINHMALYQVLLSSPEKVF